MNYHNVIPAIFKERKNRFVATVLIDGHEEAVHVKNTGRLKELLLPGASILLQCCSNPERKTKYDLIGVYKESLLHNPGYQTMADCLINIDSQAPNQVVREWLPTHFPHITFLKPEYTYGQSRLDFYWEQETEGQTGKKCLMEVKGVTLEREGTGYFPDAPTLRGVKHIRELTAAVSKGYECYIAFVIQLKGVDRVLPNDSTHEEFGEALREAQKAGVHILCLGCEVTPSELKINRCLEL
ncbi:MAG: DNA/RNA nuclease SfsA [Lachnospiraceae bacterium]|nr:DNA/RNA nuclease SfsA [Lachnospiraceae bacterium]